MHETLHEITNVEQLRVAMQKVSGTEVSDKTLIWFVCVTNARNLSECWDLRDIANLFRDGVAPIKDLQDVQNFIDTYHEDEYEDGEGTAAMLESIKEFYGK